MYSLNKATDEFVTRPPVISLPRPKTFYPSEASAKTDKVYGGCNRAAFYRLQDSPRISKSPERPSSMWAAELGNAVEDIQIRRWRDMGILVDKQVPFLDPVRNVSGKLDAVIRDPDNKLVCCEIKSFWGYQATKELLGNFKQQGKPKDNHLMQIMTYLDQAKKYISYGKLCYFARDSAKKAEFNIELVDIDGSTRAKITNVDNGYIRICNEFSLEDIYSRWQELKSYVESGVEPPRDYQIKYSDEEVSIRYTNGEISKTKYQDWQKGKASPGDWNCNYCSFSQHCWRGVVEVKDQIADSEEELA